MNSFENIFGGKLMAKRRNPEMVVMKQISNETPWLIWKALAGNCRQPLKTNFISNEKQTDAKKHRVARLTYQVFTGRMRQARIAAWKLKP